MMVLIRNLGRLLVPVLIMASGHNALAGTTLPTPEGPFPVAYSSMDLPTSEPDGLSPSSEKQRILNLQLWYPGSGSAQAASTVRPWASPAMGAALSDQFPFPAGFEREILAHARTGLQVEGEALPVVIFSHGLSFPPALYQSFFEDLASRGYAIVAVAHPHGASLIEYADGSTLDMASWPQFGEETERERFLAEHAGVWETDLRHVLDWVEAGAPGSVLEDRIDNRRIGLFGHSFGGTAAGRLSTDPRVSAVVLMEGLVRNPKEAGFRGSVVVEAPLLHLIGEYNRLEHEGAQYRPGSGAPVFQAVIRGTGHAELSDLIYLYSNFADEAWHKRRRYALEPGRIIRISRDYVAAFLDRYLRDAEPSVLLRSKSWSQRTDGPSSAGYPEVELLVDVR